MKLASEEDIQDFADDVRDVLGDKVEEIILYGSYARDDYTPGSDIDVVILVNEEQREDEEKVFDIVERYMAERDLMFSPRIYEENEFRSKEERGYSFHTNVTSEGITL
ncbi:nucleotidyltransferase domain-containing protein [Candidatus Nanohalobium constans]|uniref:Nucleotidyltransferase domain-containing protein n=1 Tax=Candidatus Nanohalobium constans TaxID=2565781 RepID=A0A5Q0UG63_9ARCH|nr:nucleotidyltransferase domain-containing protein [Candidatus Nanohalobium constans]QGA80381.1 nucleotidyltransferase domain-containing protein [Candidatus Nanohalobium constans]